MPASIVLSSLSLATPDGRFLASGIDLSFGSERTGLVGRNGVGKTTLLRVIAGDIAPAAGTVSVSGRLGYLRQSVQPRPGETIADLFGARQGLALLARAEAGLADADALADADWTLAERLAEAIDRAGLTATAETPLATLSGGEVTRARLSALVFDPPDFLLIDEPTNNLDRAGRRAVADLIAGWKGGALVIAHDRELLETMDAIVELTSLGAKRYGGAWSVYSAGKALELAAAEADLTLADRQLGEARRAAQTAAERQARRDAGGRRKRARGDAPKILMDARRERAEATLGGSARLAEGREAAALASLEEARQRIEVLVPFDVSIAPSGLPAGRTVVEVRDLAAVWGMRTLFDGLSFDIVGPERVAIVGANGSGKTTLLRLLVGDLAPAAGRARIAADFAFFDQRVGLVDPGASVLDNYRRLNPGADDNACRAALARFRFRADAALQIAGSLSGGELLRAGLAAVLGGPKPPPLLILDEPTNHLDIASIETVEAGLAAYDGALLVVSHDEAFLDAVRITRRIELGRRD